MKTFYHIIILLIFTMCETSNVNEYSYLDNISYDEYYSSEIIPSEFQGMYGMWKLYSISGGFSGQGYKPDFDYLEIKKTGIFGIITNNILEDYGKIEIDTVQDDERLKINFISLSYSDHAFDMVLFPKYVEILQKDSLNLITPCCDGYNFHFVRVH